MYIEKIKLWFKIYFGKSPISYGKFFEHFGPIIKKIGFAKSDFCEYRMTQVFDQNNQPTEEFYYSNKSLEMTTYKPTTMKEFTSMFNLVFQCRENNNGIFKLIIEYLSGQKEELFEELDSFVEVPKKNSLDLTRKIKRDFIQFISNK